MTIGNLIQTILIILWVFLTVSAYFKKIRLFKNSNGPEFQDVLYIILTIILLVIFIFYSINNWNEPLNL